MRISFLATLVSIVAFGLSGSAVQAPPGAPPPPRPLPDLGPSLRLSADDCTSARLGTAVPVEAIGEPVSGVTLAEPRWQAASAAIAAHCVVDGSMAPIDRSPTAQPIAFRVVLPEAWNRRAIQLGGGGINGVIPPLTGGRGGPGPSMGVVTFGSDSGHRSGPGQSLDWALNDEAIRNLGYMQMKKTRDAAMVIVERAYRARPRYTYYVGTSQGGREALTVAQRYPADYDGIVANVPIVGFSSLMLAPEWIRIQEKPLANWVPRAKAAAIAAEFMRQCDTLDGLADGIINNYMACRAAFDARGRRPWAARRCPGNVDPDPRNATPAACLTDGQIATLEMIYRPYVFASPLAHGARTFGMWLPTTDPSGSGLLLDERFRGQEGAAPDAPLHSHLGVLGVTGFLMRDLAANPLDYVEGGPLAARRLELSRWLDSTDPDLARFARRGGKMIVTIGTDDTLASPGAQLDYYQAVITRMGRSRVNDFARLFVMPQGNHGLSGRSQAVAGDGTAVPVVPIPNAFDRLALLTDWVERGTAPGMSVVVTAGERTLPLCSYPTYPKYVAGPPERAASYVCAGP